MFVFNKLKVHKGLLHQACHWVSESTLAPDRGHNYPILDECQTCQTSQQASVLATPNHENWLIKTIKMISHNPKVPTLLTPFPGIVMLFSIIGSKTTYFWAKHLEQNRSNHVKNRTRKWCLERCTFLFEATCAI